MLTREVKRRYQTGLEYSDVKQECMSAIQNKRQWLGDANVELACDVIQRISGSIDQALDQAYMAGVLASEKDTNEGDLMINKKQIPVQESVTFYQTQLNVSQKPKVLKRALCLISRALQVYQEFDDIKYEDDDDPDIECTAFEYWLEEDVRAYEII